MPARRRLLAVLLWALYRRDSGSASTARAIGQVAPRPGPGPSKIADPATNTFAPCSSAARRRVGVDAPVDLQRSAVAEDRAQARDLLQRVLDERLPAPPGLTVMHSAMSIASATSASAPTGVAGLIAAPTLAPRVADHAGGVGDVRRRLGVKRHRVRAGRDEIADVALGTLDHQVHVEHRAGVARLLGERRRRRAGRP